jgi:WD40 repeat protein
MLHVWDAGSGKPLQRIDGVHGSLLVAAIDAGGQRLVIGTEGSVPQRPADGLVVCALDGSAPVVVAGHEAGVRQLALSADGRRAASFADEGSLRVADLSAGRVLGVQSYAKGAVPVAVALRPDGERLVAGFADLSLRLESVVPFEVLVTGSTRDPSRADPPPDPMLVGHPWMPKALCFLPDGERVLVGDASGRLLVWDPRTGEPPAVLAETGVGFAAIALSADGRRALTSHVGTWVERRKRHPHDFDVTLWETEASAPLSRFTGMSSPPTSVAFVGEDRLLGLTGGVLRVWRLEP